MPRAVAYGLLENWLVGSVSPPGALPRKRPMRRWHCALTLPNGDAAQIVWNLEYDKFEGCKLEPLRLTVPSKTAS